MADGLLGLLGQLVMFLVEEENKQEVEPAQTPLQLMEVLNVWEMTVNHKHATPINVKVHTDR